MQQENLNASSTGGAFVGRAGGMAEIAEVHGKYSVECIGPDGKVKWTEEFDNLVTTVGKNLALDTFLAGSGYTVVGPYMGLINGSAGSAVVGDTMASHAAWLEVGGANLPTYSGTRKTVSWSSASNGSKTTSAASVWLSGGVVGRSYTISNRITTTGGRTDSRSIEIKVRKL